MRIALAALGLLAALPALAATATVPNGSITTVYANTAGTVTFSPSATISNATATAFLAWCHAHYIATPGAATDQGCFSTWFDDNINQTVAAMTQSAQTTAANAASAAIVPPAIVPAQ